jgi:hypothetical protein
MSRPDSTFRIPEPEQERFAVTVDRAVALASTGELAAGYEELARALERAEDLAGAGNKWAVTLAYRYRLALDNYWESYGVPLE